MFKQGFFQVSSPDILLPQFFCEKSEVIRCLDLRLFDTWTKWTKHIFPKVLGLFFKMLGASSQKVFSPNGGDTK